MDSVGFAFEGGWFSYNTIFCHLKGKEDLIAID